LVTLQVHKRTYGAQRSQAELVDRLIDIGSLMRWVDCSKCTRHTQDTELLPSSTWCR